LKPLDGNFNPRIAMLNADGRTVRAHKDGADIKTGLRSQLAREFTIKACK